MWDYDKLFAEDNILGIKYPDGVISPRSVNNQEIKELTKYQYANDKLSYDEWQIQYIIRLDEHGNVVKKLFDRERDIMPELKHGMFIRVKTSYAEMLGYVDMYLDKIVFQNGSWDRPSNIPNWGSSEILEIYPSTLNSFSSCTTNKAIWHKPMLN